MDTDFHFGTIYVLSRWADINEDTSFAIASGSQFVDDNTEKYADKYNGICSGHEVTENLTDLLNNNKVWIPFHFLPGLCGNTDEEKIICKKNTGLALELKEKILKLQNLTDNINVLRLGVALHVYADTWAHQGFSGNISRLNNVQELGVLCPGESYLEKEEREDFYSKLVKLGHARAIHWPDRPYAEWKCNDAFPQGRKNWDECLEAAESIFEILTQLSNNEKKVLSDKQKEMLFNVFRLNSSDDYNVRNAMWMNLVSNGYFNVKDENQHEYMEGNIVEDDNYRPAFYQAVQEHYDWVKDELNNAGIDCGL